MNGLKAEHLLKDRCIQELNDKVSELKVEALKFEGEAKKFEAMLEQQIKFNQQLEIAVRAYTTKDVEAFKPSPSAQTTFASPPVQPNSVTTKDMADMLGIMHNLQVQLSNMQQRASPSHMAPAGPSA